MQIEEHKSLKSYNTFGIECKARYFISAASIAELKEALSLNISKNIFILGGGSNLLLIQDIDALVLHINLKGITVLVEDDDHITLEVMAGENWHEFVLYCIENNYGGIENLSLIPGNVGTAPIQNIGAYGIQLKDVFEKCKAIEIESLKEVEISKEECNFGYRNSTFKNEVKGKYIITSVCLTLTKRNHILNTSYGDIQQKLNDGNIKTPTIKDISNVVIAIRESKLPNPEELGNSGSFFKNPTISATTFQEFKSKHPKAPFYEISPTQFKIPAGWLIEQAGFKGKRFGDAGVHKNQALVLINYDQASGTDIWNLALKIQEKVKEDFGIYLEPEVNVI